MKPRLLVLATVALALSAGFANPASGAVLVEEPVTEEEATATEVDETSFESRCGGSGETPPTETASASLRLASTQEDCANVYYCRRVDVARVHRTLLGAVAFKFWHWKRWCYRYPRILSVNMGTYVTNVDPNFQYRGVVSAWNHYFVWCCGRLDSGHVSYRQGRFDNCILYIGCVATYYPWVRIRAHANGTYSWNTGL
jgi:hypothetical protein